MNAISTYDKKPAIQIARGSEGPWCGWNTILDQLGSELSRGARRMSVECYPEVFEDEIERFVREALPIRNLYRTREVYKSPDEIERMGRKRTDR